MTDERRAELEVRIRAERVAQGLPATLDDEALNLAGHLLGPLPLPVMAPTTRRRRAS